LTDEKNDRLFESKINVYFNGAGINLLDGAI
jgi:hypothetical protein